MNPTLAERGRQQQKRAMAHGRSSFHPLDSELPIALKVYLQPKAAAMPVEATAEPDVEAPAEHAREAPAAFETETTATEPEPRAIAVAAMPVGVELVLWLGLLFLDAALALRDLIDQLAKRPIGAGAFPALAGTGPDERLLLSLQDGGQAANFC